MAAANTLFTHTFEGEGYPDFWTIWPDFDFSIQGNTALYPPIVDGQGWGLANRFAAVLWRGRSEYQPAGPNIQAELDAKWKNAGFAGGRSIGIILRFKEFGYCYVVRLISGGTSSARLELVKILNGVETVLDTYIGNPINGSQFNAGIRVRCAIEDLDDEDGSTRIRVYTGPNGASERGDLRIDETVVAAELRGNLTVGIECGSLWLRDDIRVRSLTVFDTLDDPGNAEPSALGTGWAIQLGTTLYLPSDLEALDPPVSYVGCGQALGLGMGSDTATFRVSRSFSSGILHPGLPVKVYHDGDVRFVGEMTQGTIIASPEESQDWTAKSAIWGATRVAIEETDKSGTRIYNVADREDESYRADRQGMTLGAVAVDLFTAFAPQLRLHGAAPASGLPYVQSEMNLLTAVIPGVGVSGNFLNALTTLLAYMPTYQVFFEPETRVFHVRHITEATGEEIDLTAEHATLTITPDPERAYTAVKWRGARQERDEDVQLDFSNRTWSDSMGETWDPSKRHKDYIPNVVILNAGTSTRPGKDPGVSYVDVSTDNGLGENDVRGAVATFADADGRDLGVKFVMANTSSRIWFDTGWSGQDGVPVPPDPGSRVFLSLRLDDGAYAAVSAMAFARSFYFPPAVLCGTSAIGMGLLNGGWCGEARVSTTDPDGTEYSQTMAYKVQVPNAAQQSAGFCPVVELSEAPKVLPSIGLINKLPPGGSPPLSECEAGGYARNNLSQLKINIKIPKLLPDVPTFRVPEGENTWRGTAYSDDESLWDGGGEPTPSDWGVRRCALIDDPDFSSMEMREGLEEAAEAILDLFSQKPYAFEIELATPWKAQLPDAPAASTSTWAGLTKRITVASDRRTTGYETISGLTVYSVWWDYAENKTIISAGTASGWLGGDFGTIAKAFTARAAAKIAAKKVKQLGDFVSKFMGKPPDSVGGQQKGLIDGCNVSVTDRNTKTVKNVIQDDEDKKAAVNHGALASLASETLFDGVEQTFAGSQPDVPGLSGSAAQQVIGGPVLGSHASHRIPFQGPVDAPNGNRSKYGGLIGADEADSFAPPETIFRRGGYAFRKKPNATGTTGGGVGLQFAPLGPHGDVAGEWSDYQSARDLPEGKAPLSMLSGGSTQEQLLERSRDMARALGQVEDQLGKIQAPGDVSEDYPDGAPADIPSMFRAAAMLPAGLRPVTNSWGDPGGLVLQGPMNDNGVDAQMLWRVRAPEMLLCEVEQVERGTGTNGGNFLWKAAASGAYVVATRLDIVHKQIDGHDLSDQGNAALRSTIAKADDPFCGVGQQGRVLPTPSGSDYAGAGGTLPMPIGATGIPAFLMTLKEDLYGPARSAGEGIAARFLYAYQASAWGSVQQTTALTAMTTDGSNTGTGQFKQPGGAVPPGLRAVSLYGNAAGQGNTVIAGLGIEVAVVEKHYFLPLSEGIGIADALVHSAPWGGEVGDLQEDYSLEVGKNLAEALAVYVGYSVELNPPFAGDEALLVGDEVALELNP